MGGEVGRWVGVGGTFGVGVGRKIREKTAHLFLNYVIMFFSPAGGIYCWRGSWIVPQLAVCCGLHVSFAKELSYIVLI